MLETRLREIKTEAETLYREMSGGEEISLKVLPSTKVSVAGVVSQSKELYVNPHFAMSKWEAEKLYPNHPSELCRLLREDPVMFARARKVLLAHEMAHIYLGHQSGRWHYHIATSLMIPSGILIIPYFNFFPFFVTLLVIRRIYVALLNPFRKLSEKGDEYQADLKAIQATKDLEGMIYFLKKAAPLFKGYSFSHPHPLERIRYLRSLNAD